MKKKVYISGAISGLPEDVYRKRFKKAEIFLKGLGYDVFNPVESHLIQEVYKKQGYAACLAKCMEKLRYCQCIYMLEGWPKSGGAIAEKAFANACKIETIYECQNNYDT